MGELLRKHQIGFIGNLLADTNIIRKLNFVKHRLQRQNLHKLFFCEKYWLGAHQWDGFIDEFSLFSI